MKILNSVNLEQEWDNISKAPFLYISSIIIIITILWFLINYIFSIRLINKDSDISLLEKQLSIYKDKKYIIGETKYSKLSDAELKLQSSENLKALQDIYYTYRQGEDEANKDFSNPKYSFNERHINSDNLSAKLMVNYDRNFKVHTILLREQILMRLPKDFKKEENTWRYEHPTNPLGFKELLGDFQTLVLNFDPVELTS